MTWSYNSSAPGSSAKSFVRLLIGDTSSGDQLFQDEELEALISAEGNNYNAAAAACESLAANFARRADQTVGALQVQLSQISRSYMRQADRMKRRARRGAGIYAGGISHSDMETVHDDTDQVRGNVKLGMTDLPGYQNPDATDSTED